MKGMIERDTVMPVLWIVLGLIISIWSAGMPFGGLKDLGPAFLPLGCGLIFVVLGSIMFLRTRRLKRGDIQRAIEPLFPHRMAGIRVTLTVLGILLSATLLKALGFVLTVFLLILFLMRVVDPQTWRVAVFYALICALGFLILFKVLLKTPLPSGFLGF